MSEYIRKTLDANRALVVEYTLKLDKFGEELTDCIATIPAAVPDDNDIADVLIKNVKTAAVKMLSRYARVRTNIGSVNELANNYDAALDRYAEQDRESGGIDRDHIIEMIWDKVGDGVSSVNSRMSAVQDDFDRLVGNFVHFEFGVDILTECVKRTRAFATAADGLNTADTSEVYGFIHELLDICYYIRDLNSKIALSSMRDTAARLWSMAETALDSANADSIIVYTRTHDSNVLTAFSGTTDTCMMRNRESVMVTIPTGSPASDWVVIDPITYKPVPAHIRKTAVETITAIAADSAANLVLTNRPMIFTIIKYNSASK